MTTQELKHTLSTMFADACMWSNKTVSHQEAILDTLIPSLRILYPNLEEVSLQTLWDDGRIYELKAQASNLVMSAIIYVEGEDDSE